MASATSRRWCFTNKYVTTHREVRVPRETGRQRPRTSKAAESGKWHASDEEVVLPARSVFVATGARPNVAYEFEHKGHFAKEHGHYRTYRDVNGTLTPVTVAPHCKDAGFGAFTSYQQDHRRVSFVGDTHPVFHGSVVKAIASGQRIYPKIVAGLGERVHRRGDAAEYAGFRARMQEQFSATVESVRRLSPSTVELTVRAPLAARHFKPGQFFRLQNFETHALLLDGTALQTEALALAGARVDADSGRVSLMVMEYGASARLVGTFQPGDPVLLMGPTGVRAKIPGVARPCSSSAAGVPPRQFCPSAPRCAPPATACCSPPASKMPERFFAATNSNRRRTRFSG